MASLYDDISIESALKRPIVLYTKNGIEENPFYPLLNFYGKPNIKYITNNLHTFFKLIQNTDCISFGLHTENIDFFNPLFRKDKQLHFIPIRENFDIKVLRYVNKNLTEIYDGLLFEIINQRYY